MSRLITLCVLSCVCAGPLIAQDQQKAPISWRLGHPYKVKYLVNNQPIGTEVFTITRIQHQGKDAYQMKSKVELKTPQVTMKSDTTLIVGLDLQPLSYQAAIHAGAQQANIVATFTPGKVKEKVTGTTAMEREIQLPQQVYCLDNNLVGSLALISPSLEYKVGSQIKASTFFPSVMQQLSATVSVTRQGTFDIGGKQVAGYQGQLQIGPSQITLWVDKAGRLLKGQQGPVVYIVEE